MLLLNVLQISQNGWNYIRANRAESSSHFGVSYSLFQRFSDEYLTKEVLEIDFGSKINRHLRIRSSTITSFHSMQFTKLSFHLLLSKALT